MAHTTLCVRGLAEPRSSLAKSNQQGQRSSSLLALIGTESRRYELSSKVFRVPNSTSAGRHKTFDLRRAHVRAAFTATATEKPPLDTCTHSRRGMQRLFIHSARVSGVVKGMCFYATSVLQKTKPNPKMPGKSMSLLEKRKPTEHSSTGAQSSHG